jgi:hypothetical protein
MVGWFNERVANRWIYTWNTGRITVWLDGWMEGRIGGRIAAVWLARWRQAAVPCRSGTRLVH